MFFSSRSTLFMAVAMSMSTAIMATPVEPTAANPDDPHPTVFPDELKEKVHAYTYNSNCEGAYYEWKLENIDGPCLKYERGTEMYSVWIEHDHATIETYEDDNCQTQMPTKEVRWGCWGRDPWAPFKSFKIKQT
ncbi:hypothetical protein BJX70DRAFT_401465 [Aspergillus crustosus]